MEDHAWNISCAGTLFLFLLLFVPESPRWLTIKGNEPAAFRVLKKIVTDDEAQKEIGISKQIFRVKQGDLAYCSKAASDWL